jgi:hypothetical protein
LVCEDGMEYLERFERFLGTRYQFVQSQCAGELLLHVVEHAPIVAVLLDLDFRRTDGSRLIDEEGNALERSKSEERKRLIANQGIAIAKALRRVGSAVPILLFADVPGPQARFLEQHFVPLTVVPSHVSLRELQDKLETLTLYGTHT